MAVHTITGTEVEMSGPQIDAAGGVAVNAPGIVEPGGLESEVPGKLDGQVQPVQFVPYLEVLGQGALHHVSFAGIGGSGDHEIANRTPATENRV